MCLELVSALGTEERLTYYNIFSFMSFGADL